MTCDRIAAIGGNAIGPEARAGGVRAFKRSCSNGNDLVVQIALVMPRPLPAAEHGVSKP